MSRLALLALLTLVACATAPSTASQPVSTPAPAAEAAPTTSDRPEAVFAGQIVVTKTQLPEHFPSASVFTAALKAERATSVWAKRAPFPAGGTWSIPYIAFLTEPMTGTALMVSFYDGERLLTTATQRIDEPGSRIIASDITLSKPEFEAYKTYRMTISQGPAVLASTVLGLMDIPAGAP